MSRRLDKQPITEYGVDIAETHYSFPFSFPFGERNIEAYHLTRILHKERLGDGIFQIPNLGVLLEDISLGSSVIGRGGIIINEERLLQEVITILTEQRLRQPQEDPIGIVNNALVKTLDDHLLLDIHVRRGLEVGVSLSGLLTNGVVINTGTNSVGKLEGNAADTGTVTIIAKPSDQFYTTAEVHQGMMDARRSKRKPWQFWRSIRVSGKPMPLRQIPIDNANHTPLVFLTDGINSTPASSLNLKNLKTNLLPNGKEGMFAIIY